MSMERVASLFKNYSCREILLKICSILLCLSGFGYQTYHVSSIYFAYTTVTRLEFEAQSDMYEVPSLVMCVRYFDVIDQQRLKAETGIILNRINDLEGAATESRKLTVAQILEYTPTGNQTIRSCLVHVKEYVIEELGADACNQMYNVSKYYTQEYVCYSYDAVKPFELSVNSLVSALHGHYGMFRFSLSDQMHNLYRVNLIPVFQHDDTKETYDFP
jgi:hypothetical protein